MTKNLFVILIAVVLVLAIVVGVISAMNVPDGGGNIIDNIIGNGSETTGSDVTTVAPGIGSDDDDPYLTQLNNVKVLNKNVWESIDYAVEYEPEYVSSGSFAGYIVYIKLKLQSNTMYKLAFDTSKLVSYSNSERGVRYFDTDENKWANITENSLTGSFVGIKSDNDGYIKICPVYNFSTPEFYTSERAVNFAKSLPDKEFSLMISSIETQVVFKANGQSEIIPYTVTFDPEIFEGGIAYIPCIEIDLNPNKKYSVSIDFSSYYSDYDGDAISRYYDVESGSWNQVGSYGEMRYGTFLVSSDKNGIIRIVPYYNIATTGLYDEINECNELIDLLKKTEFSIKISPVN